MWGSCKYLPAEVSHKIAESLDVIGKLAGIMIVVYKIVPSAMLYPLTAGALIKSNVSPSISRQLDL